jgi:hypothetical protein
LIYSDPLFVLRIVNWIRYCSEHIFFGKEKSLRKETFLKL